MFSPRLFSLLLLCCFVAGSGRDTSAADREKSAAKLTSPPAVEKSEQQIQEDLEYLAADAREGRDTGSAGIQEAADYIHERFESLGWETPRQQPDGLQEFTITGRPEMGEDVRLEAKLSGKRVEFKLDEDYRPCSFGGSGEISAPLVFCGYGIDDAENGFDEFANVDVKDKVALIIRRVPQQLKFGSLYVNKQGQIDVNRAALRSKMENAKKRGAVAVLFVNDPHSTKEGKETDLFSFGYGGAGNAEEIPAFQITQPVADRLLKAGLGLTLKEVEKTIDAELEPLSEEFSDIMINAHADLDFSSTTGMNVVGVLPGKNPESQKTVIIGAHYDHVGWGKFGSLAPGTEAIHNGADDNASGTTAILELARRLAPHKGEFEHTIVLICFAAEERGLLGSKHYVSDPLFPLDKTLAMINLDMVGRMADEKLTVFGVGSSDVWNNWLDPLEERTELNFFRERKAFGPSDHASFYEKEIPVLHLFTGLHDDYHKPTDDVDEVNVQGIRRVCDLLEGLTTNLAQSTQDPKYIEVKERIQVGRHAGGRSFVGVIPQLDSKQSGLTIETVVAGSPAALAGLEAGDRILQVGKKEIETRAQFWEIVDAGKPKQELPLTIQRGDTKMSVKLKLGDPR